MWLLCTTFACHTDNDALEVRGRKVGWWMRTHSPRGSGRLKPDCGALTRGWAISLLSPIHGIAPVYMQMGRMARLAQRALNTDMMTSDLSTTAESAAPEGTHSQSVAPVAGVEVVSLLRSGGRRRGGGAREGSPDDEEEEDAGWQGRNSTLRDFKKFRKVCGCNIYSGLLLIWSPL